MSRLAILLLLISSGVLAADEGAPRPEDIEHFEAKIRPLLVERCYSCHSSKAKTIHGGFRIDSAEAMAKGGDSGLVIDANHLKQSLLLDVVRYDGDIQMPPKGKLSAPEIAEFTIWIQHGM